MFTFPNGKKYVGITVDFKNRMRTHKCLGYGNQAQRPLYNAISKYGWENIKKEILFEGLTEDEAYAKEIELIEKYALKNFDNGYNLANGGRTLLGIKWRKPSPLKGRNLPQTHINNLIRAKAGKSYSNISSTNATIYAVSLYDYKTNETKTFKNVTKCAADISAKIHTVYNHIRRDSKLLANRYKIKYIK